MSNTISRRDFLGGTALVIAAGLTPLAQMRAEPGRYYPPSLTGLRGSHPGSFEVAHQVGREGKSFDISGLAVEQSFDLVVVGGGISGLAAAWFYREAHGPTARILILENHDDFGGHAKRNEFRVDDRLLLGYGGTESLQSPKTFFSKTVNRLLRSLGVVAWLTANEEVIWERVSRNHNRPLLRTPDPRTTIINLMSTRYPLYSSLADITVETSGLTHQEVADSAIAAIRLWPNRPK